MESFKKSELKKLYKPPDNSKGEENGQVVIIGGSSLFHGAPLLSLTVASRIVDMVFFTSPFGPLEKIANKIKSRLFSFIWIPWEEVDFYIKKADSILIGPGFLRYKSEKQKDSFCDIECQKTRKITKNLLEKFFYKKWVIDAGSLQAMDPKWIPPNSILTPNQKEYDILFDGQEIDKVAKKYKCVIALKGIKTIVSDGEKKVMVKGGNAGLTKGGTGDVQAGLTVALYAKNDPFISAAAASFIVKKTAEKLFKRRGVFFNADDLALAIPPVLKHYLY